MGNPLSFAEEFQKNRIQWTDDTPLYGQHAWDKNLLRHHIGSRVFGDDEVRSWEMDGVLDDSSQSARALISDDPTIPVAIGKGERTFDFALGQKFLLRRVSFMNEGLAGELELWVAATDPVEADGRWVKIVSHSIDRSQRENVVKFAAVDARYIRLKFSAEKEGKIYGLGAFGIRKAIEFYDPAERGVREDALESRAAASAGAADDAVDVDESGPLILVDELDSSVTNAIGYARVELVSSSASGDPAEVAQILDEDSTSQFHFADDDPSPTVVIDLGKSSDCGRVSVIFKAGARGKMNLWLGDPKVPGSRSEVGETFEIGTASLQVRLKRTVADGAGTGRLSFNQFRRSGRYLILQWEGEIVARPQGESGFGIYEVAVFEHRAEGESFAEPLRKLVMPNSRKQIPRDLQVPVGRGDKSDLPQRPPGPAGREIFIKDVPVSR